MKNSKWLLLGITCALLTVFLWAASWYRNSQAKISESLAQAHAELLVRPYSPEVGLPGAKVTIVEFFDPQCEACRAIYPLAKDLLKEFEGKVRLVLRYMPLHKDSIYASTVLEAARKQGKYWETLELLFAKQSEWGGHEASKPELILTYLPALGLDVEQLKVSLNDAEHLSKIQQDKDDGTKLGVLRTPSFFVNGKLQEQLGPEPLRAAIRAALGE